METKAIQKRLDTMVKAMLAKGLREPNAKLYIEANAETIAFLTWQKPGSIGRSFSDEVWKSFRGALPDILKEADAHIAAQPTAEQARLNDFMAALGGVIDLGRKHNIEVAFLNPLTETMKRLAENAITHEAA